MDTKRFEKNIVVPKSVLLFALVATLVGSAVFSGTSYACSQDPYIGDICAVPYTRGCPSGYLPADGRYLQVSQYAPLYSLIGITFGGNGTTNFAVPDLRGRVVVGAGAGPGLTSVTLGLKRGQESVALTANNLPAHTHPAEFTATTGPQPINIPAQPASGSITATATTDIVPGGSGVDPAPSVNNYYLTGVGGPGTGPVTTTTPGADKSTLIGATVNVNSSTYTAATAAQTVNVNTVTGGKVLVGQNTTTNTPVYTLPPELGLTYCIATQGLYPSFD